MRKSTKEKWIAALRSGEYKQGSSRLYDPETGCYCCLGVLARMTGVDPREVRWSSGIEFLTSDFLEKIGAMDIPQDKLSNMNDGMVTEYTDQKSFAEIADWIEENI